MKKSELLHLIVNQLEQFDRPMLISIYHVLDSIGGSEPTPKGKEHHGRIKKHDHKHYSKNGQRI